MIYEMHYSKTEKSNFLADKISERQAEIDAQTRLMRIYYEQSGREYMNLEPIED
jgi:hypothetical protein